MTKKTHPDDEVQGNKIIRLYDSLGRFTDLTVDQTISRKLNRWEGWLCSAGLLHLYVSYDGHVLRGNCKVGGRLGNVFTDFDLPTEWITCDAEFCSCGSDVMTPKIKSQRHLKKLKNTLQKEHGWWERRRNDIQKPVAVETAFRPPPHIRVLWDVGRRCNYSCSYCWPSSHSKTEALRTYEQMQYGLEKIYSKLPQDKQILFQFAGGEPTLIPKFIELMREIRERGHRIVVTSNGSRAADFWEELIQLASVNISVHFEFADLDRLFKNIETMIHVRSSGRGGEWLEIKLMTPPGRLPLAQEFCARILKIPDFEKYASWSFVPIRYPSTDQKEASRVVEYTSQELGMIQNRELSE